MEKGATCTESRIHTCSETMGGKKDLDLDLTAFYS